MKFTRALLTFFITEGAQALQSFNVPETPKLELNTAEEDDAHNAAAKQLETLQSSLAEVQHKESAWLESHKMQLEGTLKKAYDDNVAVQNTNEGLAKRIKEFQKSNVDLRSEATKLQQTNEQLHENLKRFRGNMSVADEFMDKFIDVSHQALHKAEELQILKDLADEDSEKQRKALQEARIKEVEGHPHVAMLQQDAIGHGKQHEQKNFEDMITNLQAELKRVSDTKATTKASLDLAFQEGMNKTAAANANLVQKTSSLQATLDTTTAVNSKLVSVVKHLRDTHKTLLEKTESLHRFAMRLSAATKSEGEKKADKFQTKQELAMDDYVPKKGLINWLR